MSERLEAFAKSLHWAGMGIEDVMRYSYEFARALVKEEARIKAHGLSISLPELDIAEKAATMLYSASNQLGYTRDQQRAILERRSKHSER